MVGVIQRNLRYVLWREGVDRRQWSAQLAAWLGSSMHRAELLMEEGSLTHGEIERISDALGVDGGELLYRDLLEDAQVDILCENLRYLIKSLPRGSQKKLARSLNVHHNTVSRWLKDQRPERSKLMQLVVFFGLQPDTDLSSDPIFLSSTPISEMERKAWLKKSIDEMNPRKLNELFPALKLLLKD
jgi:transcriptional regulator with XRE-family HTH domain